MNSRDKYFILIQDKKINNVLGLIEELSYSKKLKALEKLLHLYSSKQINFALNTYQVDYINLNRIDLIRIVSTLKYLCKGVFNE